MNCESCGHQNLDEAHFCANCGVVLPSSNLGSEDPFVGKLVGGRFRITRLLGEGGMGIVYEGEQQMGSTTRKVAVKTLHKHLSSDPSVSARFHRECGTIAQLEHPNTIKVYDFGATDDGTLYIAMEFLKGQSLDHLVAVGPVAPDRVLRIIRQIAGSLAEAHRQGIIHRDLKPENIVLIERAGEKDVVKLLDFGIAARTESRDAAREQKLTQQGMVLGTPPYMSPEQFTGEALDHRSDIYSLGVVAYEMLTGTLPFEANTAWQWATQHMTAQPRSFEETAVANAPAGMRQAVMRALSKNPADRQQSVSEFAEELGAEVAAVDTSVGATTGTEKMAAVPAFAAVVEERHSPGQMSAVARTVAQPRVTPQQTPTHEPKSGKGPVIGLAVAGVLLAGGIALATLGTGKGDEPSEPLALPTTAPEPPPAVTEAVDPPEPSEPAAEPETTIAPTTATRPITTTATKKPAAATTTPAPKAPEPTGPAPTVAKKPEPKKPEEVKPEPKKPTVDSCEACIAAANGGNLAGARGAYNSCTDSSQKAKCSSIATRKAGSAAKAASKNGDCGQVAAIAAAAAPLGAMSPVIERELKKCKSSL